LIGETVIAIGNPFGFSNTVTTGVISATNRSIRANDRVYHDFIQIDASINPGNSGGPLLNINGALIGINTAIYAKAQGIGFAIPINKAKRIINDLIRYGEVIQAWVGIIVQNLTPDLAEYLNLDRSSGVLVKAIEPESPAADAGIKEGDVILKVARTPIASQAVYKRVMKGFAAGDAIQFSVLRDGAERQVEVLSKIFPMERALVLAQRLLGITVTHRASEQDRPAEALEGVMIEDVSRHAYLAQIGVRPGDVIRQIDDITVRNLEDFKKAMIKFRHKKTLVILLQRGDQGYYISVKL
jgi:S1-C subfamily serine protease